MSGERGGDRGSERCVVRGDGMGGVNWRKGGGGGGGILMIWKWILGFCRRVLPFDCISPPTGLRIDAETQHEELKMILKAGRPRDKLHTPPELLILKNLGVFSG